jgi:hypothetical protein
MLFSRIQGYGPHVRFLFLAALPACILSSQAPVPVHTLDARSGQAARDVLPGSSIPNQTGTSVVPGAAVALKSDRSPAATAPVLALSSTPASVQQNASANPNCQWEHQLFLREQAGVETQLTRFLAGGFDLSGQIQQFFGTTRLAPFGTLATEYVGKTVPRSG